MRRFKTTLVGMAIAMLLVTMCGGAWAASWDAAAQFSGTTSDGPVWKYGGYSWSDGGFYTFTTEYLDPWGAGINMWDWNHAVVPFVGKSGAVETSPFGWVVPTNSIIVHPSGADAGTNPYGPGEASVVRWIAPSGVTSIDITGGFTALAGGTFRGRVYKNMGLLFDTTSIGPDNYTLQSVALNGISVALGDKIDFAITYGATYTNNWTKMDALITENVPEPASLLALGSGLIGMAGFGLRRRRG